MASKEQLEEVIAGLAYVAGPDINDQKKLMYKLTGKRKTSELTSDEALRLVLDLREMADKA